MTFSSMPPATMNIMLGVATFTALLASTMAMVAKDMKRVLAFSSISQLGFMLMGLAAGSLFAGFFHLTTHAFFKALLFLCAGAYIHHLGTNDMIAMGRAGAAKMRLTTIALIIGGAALGGDSAAGRVLLQGADHRLAARARTDRVHDRRVRGRVPHCVLHLPHDLPADAARTRSRMRPRMNRRGAQHGGDHAHAHHGPAEPLAMLLPMGILAIGALAAGFFGDQIGAVLGITDIHHPSIGEMAPAIADGARRRGPGVAEFRPGAIAADRVCRVHPRRAEGPREPLVYRRVLQRRFRASRGGDREVLLHNRNARPRRRGGTASPRGPFSPAAPLRRATSAAFSSISPRRSSSSPPLPCTLE